MSSTSYLRQVKGITWLLQLKVTKKFKGMVLCREDTQISHSFQYSHYKQKERALSYCTGLIMVAKEAEKMCHLCNQGASCPIYSIWVKWRMTTLDGGRWSSSKSVVPCMGQFTTLTLKVLSHELLVVTTHPCDKSLMWHVCFYAIRCRDLSYEFKSAWIHANPCCGDKMLHTHLVPSCDMSVWHVAAITL